MTLRERETISSLSVIFCSLILVDFYSTFSGARHIQDSFQAIIASCFQHLAPDVETLRRGSQHLEPDVEILHREYQHLEPGVEILHHGNQHLAPDVEILRHEY